MSFRRVFVQSLFALTALTAGPVLAQTPPAEAPATPAQASPAQAEAHTGPLFGDAKAGESKAAVCGACHGMDGNPTDKQYPKLAGQNEAYIARQISLFKSQKRQNPIMMGFAATQSDQDMHDIGAYFASKASLPEETPIACAQFE